MNSNIQLVIPMAGEGKRFQDKYSCPKPLINVRGEKMMEDGIHYFWHENDRFTLTSKGIPWCYPNNYNKKGIVVVFDDSLPSNLISGVCTDYPLTVRKKMLYFSK